MQRTTKEHLQGRIDQINAITKSPLEPYKKRRVKGRYPANVGHYCLDSAYGGVMLVRICSDTGAETNISSGGYITKRELFDQLGSMINILVQAKGKARIRG